MEENGRKWKTMEKNGKKWKSEFEDENMGKVDEIEIVDPFFYDFFIQIYPFLDRFG